MSDFDDYDFLFKSVIVGDSNVGKTQILSRFMDNQFTLDSKPTVGVQFGTKTIFINGTSVKNQIWDTAGQQRFRALTCAYYRGAVGAIVVFDLSKNNTFEHVQRWIRQIKQYSEPQVCILLVGNKSDLQNHQVKQQDIQNFAIDNKLIYISTSAATGQNVELAFETLVKEILKQNTPQQDTLQVVLNDIQQDEKVVTKKSTDNIQNEKKNSKKSTNNSQVKSNESNKQKMRAFQVQQSTKKLKLKSDIQKDKKTKKNCC